MGESVLMHDTDSIIYHYKPNQEYTPTLGHLLGDWERDKIHRKGTPVEFWGLRPKSYGLRTNNGAQIMKLKGISITLDNPHLTFEAVRDLILTGAVSSRSE